jgi:hypothetical protein
MKEPAVQHIAGKQIGGLQRCERCGMVLIDHKQALLRETQYHFWQVGLAIYNNGQGWSVTPGKNPRSCLVL